MKISLFRCAILPALLLSLAVPFLAQAADTANPAPMPPPSLLDNDEIAQLQKARVQVFSANPDLKAEEEKLKAFHDSAQSTPPSAEQKTAMFAEWKDYRQKMRAAMLKIDPTLKPIFAKLDQAAKHHGAAASPPAPASAK